MIVDQDCPCNAQQAVFFVSSEGELYRNDQLVNDTPAPYAVTVDFTEREIAFRDKVYALADVAGFGRFRVYGEIRASGEECIVLVTEFLNFCDCVPFWDQVAAVIKKTKAHTWVMIEKKHLDRSKYADEAEWREGPDHGRMERQVELSWRIENKSPATLQKLIDRLVAVTDPIFGEAGVVVC